MAEVLGTLPSFTYTSKNTNQVVNASGNVDGGTLLRIVDPANNIDAYTFPLAYGRTTVVLQLQVVASSTVASRPTWVQVELARIKYSPSNSIISVDTTSPMRRSIVQPGTTTFSDSFSVQEFVNEDDGEFGFTLTHNGSSSVRVTVDIIKVSNPSADRIHEAHGFNMWSDGSIH